jgi:hypothetical protein
MLKSVHTETTRTTLLSHHYSRNRAYNSVDWPSSSKEAADANYYMASSYCDSYSLFMDQRESHNLISPKHRTHVPIMILKGHQNQLLSSITVISHLDQHAHPGRSLFADEHKGFHSMPVLPQPPCLSIMLVHGSSHEDLDFDFGARHIIRQVFFAHYYCLARALRGHQIMSQRGLAS